MLFNFEYPYQWKKTQCQEDEKSEFKSESFKYLKQSRPDQLKAALNVGPVSLVINARSDVFKFYSKGILKSKKCGTNGGHAVIAVGYGNDEE